MDEYWDICSNYIFHFTYSYGSPNELRDIILSNISGNPSIFDIVEPHKSRQEYNYGSKELTCCQLQNKPRNTYCLAIDV